jgi:transposase
MYEKKVSYVGKKVFVGIDVHLKFYQVTCFCDGVRVHKFRCNAIPVELACSLLRMFQGAELESCYETGFSGFVLHRVLCEVGIKNRVVNAGDVETSSRKDKTDKRDSQKLAEQLMGNRLKAIAVPTEEQELRRQLTRVREQLMRKRTSTKNQIRMRFHYFGLLAHNEKREMSFSLVREVLEKVDSPALVTSIEVLVATWEGLDEQLKRVTTELNNQAKSDEFEAIYRKLPGIGALSSRVLSNELGDLRRFPNMKALYRYTGLTPSEHSSAEKRRLGHISREGNSRLRHVLVEAAWNALSKDKGLKQYFDKLAARAGKKRAIVAVARKLVGRARALFISGGDYKIAA